MKRMIFALTASMMVSAHFGLSDAKKGLSLRWMPEARADAASSDLEANYEKALRDDPFTKEGGSYSYQDRRKFTAGTSISKEQDIKEMAGRAIWFKSSPNERLHTYYLAQKANFPIAWYSVLRADRKEGRFQTWGLINDPDCCVPGTAECNEKGLTFDGRPVTMEDTFGWEYCSGDEALLKSIRNPKANPWKDPACDDPTIQLADSFDKGPREDRCELAFGTPTGAVGFRKFPNPRFNPKLWEKVGGWEGYEKRMKTDALDASIEPPFRVGIACASCHAAFDPLHPPTDTAHPTWANIKAETGNQYLNISAIFGSGAKMDSLEFQIFTHGRAGTVDTSAVPNDFTNNSGTQNAIINLPKRPTFIEDVISWEPVQSCPAPSATCQEIKYKDGRTKFWNLTRGQKPVMHILKGGEDSVGPHLAVQRVYVNIGMCAEQCWVNHLTNLRELDPSQRGFGQTPFDIGQCRRDCASFRANEDRIMDIVSYLLSRRPTDLKDAKFSTAPEEVRDVQLTEFLGEKYKADGDELVSRGKTIYAERCARCHSSQNSNKQDLVEVTDDFSGVDFLKTETLANGEILRKDWLGNEKSTSQSELGTYACRSMHSNHMRGHVWEQFGSEKNKARPMTVTGLRSQVREGGPGYFRNISLLNVWAHAPFLHNNAVGPELCGAPKGLAPEENTWRTSVDGHQLAPANYNCEASFDPSVEGRFELFDKSMDEILTAPEQRRKKIAKTDKDIIFPLGVQLKVFKGSSMLGTAPLYLVIPKGFSVNEIGSFDIKSFLVDLYGALPYYEAIASAVAKSNEEAERKAREAYDQYWLSRTTNDKDVAAVLSKTSQETFAAFASVFAQKTDMKTYLESIKKNENDRLHTYLRYYSNCDANAENAGHNFGTNLSQEDKNALKAFMANF